MKNGLYTDLGDKYHDLLEIRGTKWRWVSFQGKRGIYGYWNSSRKISKELKIRLKLLNFKEYATKLSS